ncbi:hypothetical protein DFJ63DRAFT_290149 [Scheffersomyces coipomensis]|uniref:uncharacterized protein n=1 Tax=Scheffersomyces coipomensis TaxID=1788519 RepID=UPI00315C6F7D
MSKSFANIYWSPDIISGINSLGNQSRESIHQLHDLRKLVFSYINYFYANSEHLYKLGIDLNSTENSFVSRDDAKKQVNRKASSSIRSPTESANDKHEEQDITVEYAYKTYINDLMTESTLLTNQASVIEREVMENINSFIKYHESNVRMSISDLKRLYEDYTNTYHKVLKLKNSYEEFIRSKELEHESIVEKTANISISSDSEANESSASIIQETVVPSPTSDFIFPIHIGSKEINEIEELRTLLTEMHSTVPTIKRKIAIPGSKNDIFSSDSLTDYIRKKNILGKVPTRSSIEKFGQSLLDQKFVIGSGFWGSKTFKSEGIWLEWSPLTEYIISYDSNEETTTTLAASESRTSKSAIEESSTAFMNNMVSNTSKLFKTVKSTMKRGEQYESLEEIEELYESAYLELQALKFNLDKEILAKSQALETFEKLRIDLVYSSLTKLSTIIYNFSLSSTTRLHGFAVNFTENINQKENPPKDLDNLINKFSSGIFYASNLVPESLQKSSSSVLQPNSNFQSIKLKFNLYIDIPLQVLLYQSADNDDSSSLLSMRSIPLFLHDLIKLIESKDDKVTLQAAWSKPLNHQEYWSIKENAIKFINQYSDKWDGKVTKESDIHASLIHDLIESLQGISVDHLVNFAKLWLLEVSDSIIPCSVYDSLCGLYKSSSTDKRKDELVKVLGFLSRSNLASLILLLEHIVTAFDLASIPNYELSDNFESLESNDDLKTVDSVSSLLNSMDEIGSIPFVHLILRPSPSKSAGGVKPDMSIYGSILRDLLVLDTRGKLFETLVDKEKVYNQKRQAELAQPIPKIEILAPAITETPSTPVKVQRLSNGNMVPLSPIPLKAELFSPRPFRTGNTPNPSPRGSPIHKKRDSLNVLDTIT